MKITNRKNLPQIIVDAVTNDPYNPGDKTDYSATTLLRPAYQVMLQKNHSADIVEDVSDRLWTLYGSAMHHIIERASIKEVNIVDRVNNGFFGGMIVEWIGKCLAKLGKGWKLIYVNLGFARDFDDIETRYYATVNGKVISAQIDHLYILNGDLTDWKLTAAYKIQKALQSPDEDWTAQLNIQAYILSENGIDVRDLYIGACCRDWRKFDAQTKPGYPDQIEYIKLPKWSKEEQFNYISARIEAMEEAKPCTAEERWQDPPSYALMKAGGVRALKVSGDRSELEPLLSDKIGLSPKGSEKTHYIETRESPNKRCEFYCNVNVHCDYYKKHYAKADDLPLKA